MNNKNKYLLEMMNSVKELIEENGGVINDLTRFDEYFPTFKIYVENAAYNRKKVTIAKDEGEGLTKKCRRDLIDIVLFYSQGMVAFAESIHYAILKQKVYIQKYQLAYFSQARLCEKALYLYNQAQSRLDELMKYGITQEKQRSFQELIRAYAEIQLPPVDKPLPRQPQRREHNLRNGMKLLKNMDFIVESYKLQYPDFYQKWFKARVLNELSKPQEVKKIKRKLSRRKFSNVVGKKFLRVRIMDSEGLLINNTTVIISTIEPKNWVIYKITVSGLFKTSILSPGNYSVKVAKGGFQTLILPFKIEGKDKETLDLVLKRAENIP